MVSTQQLFQERQERTVICNKNRSKGGTAKRQSDTTNAFIISKLTKSIPVVNERKFAGHGTDDIVCVVLLKT